MARVMRLNVGDQVVLFDGQGCEATAVIKSMERKSVTLQAETPRAVSRELSFQLVAGVALPKSDRLRFLVEKLTEIGLSDLYPVHWQRSSVQPRPATIERTRRYVIEASKQCGRNQLMQIHPPVSFAEWCRMPVDTAARLCFDTGQWPLATAELRPADQPVWFGIGPAGGLTDDELALAAEQQWRMVSLGSRTLRTETAAIAAAVTAITVMAGGAKRG